MTAVRRLIQHRLFIALWVVLCAVGWLTVLIAKEVIA